MHSKEEAKNTEKTSFAWEMLREYGRANKRLSALLLIVSIMWFCTIATFVWYFNQYDYTSTATVTVDAGNGTALYQNGEGNKIENGKDKKTVTKTRTKKATALLAKKVAVRKTKIISPKRGEPLKSSAFIQSDIDMLNALANWNADQAKQELQHAHDMFELIMRHADKKGVHKETSFESMKHSMKKAFDEAKEEIE